MKLSGVLKGSYKKYERRGGGEGGQAYLYVCSVKKIA